MNNIEELLEFEGCTPRKDRHQFLGNQVWNSTGECIFLEDSHRLTTIAQICLYAAQFSVERRWGRTRRNDPHGRSAKVLEFVRIQGIEMEPFPKWDGGKNQPALTAFGVSV